MPLLHKPHTATVKAVADKVASQIVAGVQRTSGTSITGQLTVKAPSFAFERYNLDVSRPALWMCDVADAASFKAGDYLTVSGVDWKVLTDPQTHDAQTLTSHASALLSRKEH